MNRVTTFSVSEGVMVYAVMCGIEGLDWVILTDTYGQYYLN